MKKLTREDIKKYGTEEEKNLLERKKGKEEIVMEEITNSMDSISASVWTLRDNWGYNVQKHYTEADQMLYTLTKIDIREVQEQLYYLIGKINEWSKIRGLN